MDVPTEMVELVRLLITTIGDNPDRDGLKDTPVRFFRTYTEILDGYNQDPKQIAKTFECNYTGMTIFQNIPYYSLCEHHLLPMFGTVSIGILPSTTNKVIGFNKIPRLVDIYAHRLQIQERMTQQITDCLENILEPSGVAVIVKARHLCAEMRGIKKHGHFVLTSDYRGRFLEDEVQQDFISKLERTQ